MNDITHKNVTYRRAVAQAVLKVSRKETILAIEENRVPKGHVFEMARAAGLLGVKRTPDLIPDCHPIPVEHAAVRYEINGLAIHIEMEVAAIYKTGVEVEAMHGVSVVALTMYDMLKPIDKEIEISTIRLLEKKGGKSDFTDAFRKPIRAAVVVCSDTVSAGQKEDKAGKIIREKLSEHGVETSRYTVIADEAAAIERELLQNTDDGIDLVIFTGGTGLSIRDITPEVITPLLDRDIPGIAEAMRRYGQDRMPYAMLSRSVAGIRKKSLVLTFPGSTGGAGESMDAIFPQVLHVFRIIAGARH